MTVDHFAQLLVRPARSQATMLLAVDVSAWNPGSNFSAGLYNILEDTLDLESEESQVLTHCRCV